jgi:hypothetical protein
LSNQNTAYRYLTGAFRDVGAPQCGDQDKLPARTSEPPAIVPGHWWMI